LRRTLKGESDCDPEVAGGRKHRHKRGGRKHAVVSPQLAYRPLSVVGLVHVWSTIHRNAAVASGRQRSSFAQIAAAIL
jgi:hypothetical protein